jgi:hypothetical protein
MRTKKFGRDQARVVLNTDAGPLVIAMAAAGWAGIIATALEQHFERADEILLAEVRA